MRYVVEVSCRRINCVPVRTFVSSIEERIISLLKENAVMMMQTDASAPSVRTAIAGVIRVFRSKLMKKCEPVLLICSGLIR
jgi:hypothetical protein